MTASRLFLLFILLPASSICVGDESKSAASTFEAKRLKEHVEYLASKELAGRRGRNALKAAVYIKLWFQQFELEPLFGKSYTQDIPGPSTEDNQPTLYGRNVGGVILGSDPKLRDELIIVSAHYDHLGGRPDSYYPGADDNASGTAMLLEMARVMSRSKKKTKRSVAFVAFALEERYLWGSRWFTAHSPWPLKKVKFFITADMIGRSLGDLPIKTIFVMGSEHSTETASILKKAGEPDDFGVALMGIDLIGTRSDYGPFRDKKIPFLFFSTGEHPDYHKKTDTPDKVNYRQVAAVASLIHKILDDLAAREKSPEWIEEFEPPLSEVKAINRIAGLLLEQDKKKPLSTFQKLLVTNAQLTTKKIIERGKVTESERNGLIRTAQLMLFSIF